MADLLQLGPGFQERIPGIGEVLYPNLGKPVSAPVHDLAYVAERDCFPLAIDDGCLFRGFMPAAVPAANFLGDVADIDKLLIEQGPSEGCKGNIWTIAGRNRRRNTGPEAADANQLVVHENSGNILIFGYQRLLEKVIVCLNERSFVHEGQGLRLRLRPVRGQQCNSATKTCDLENIATWQRPDDVCHSHPR